ncbi:hypothetical protein OBA44_05970 [Bacteroidota bacterium]|jgi:hypothetical protein|nr:hypothetical protein [Balneola sp.]MBL6825798.1 hypothetical protein [Balneolaceae bacterium]MDA0736780.1 hypothetical protein [Bacteroidota bacterium]OUX47415.1 MAG: hypothetical protein CBE44_03410 [Bacteroidetes bacterium TMED284]PDH54240.1 MAG: hypothetical protein CNE38_05735 [Rhodothermaeota bacterium MED-G12]|tara:strand:+ start:4637 stop:4888 length:252 start_codon:yes stop_codon:yes gene_type:complete
MNVTSEHTERFKELLEEVYTEVDLLKKQLKEAKREQLHLIKKLEEERGKQTDIFSAISESERLAMRQQITSMIHKIDRHLESN